MVIEIMKVGGFLPKNPTYVQTSQIFTLWQQGSIGWE